MTGQSVEIDICICTFRRTHVVQTIKSIAGLNLQPSWKLRIIVADNDEKDSARKSIEAVTPEIPHPITYIHAPARNISLARNACLDAAAAPLLAFIDDDEIATPEWLAALLTTLESSHADVVLGPVRAIYRLEAPRWMRDTDLHSTSPVRVNGKIVTGYSCNVLFRRTARPVEGLRFRVELGRSGGEDTAFFADVHQAGGRIAYAADAIVTEEVTPDRARLGWLVRRRFRAGQTHGLLLSEKNSLIGRAQNFALAGAKMAFCYGMAAAALWRRDHGARWLLRGTVHAGVLARLAGKREAEHYG